MKKLALIFVAIFVFHGSTSAQRMPIKFGKVSKEELLMEKYDKDPSAEAVVLCDYGTASIEHSRNQGWTLDFKRTCRIKIFNPDGFKWATEKIHLYDYGGIEQDLGGLKGYTYNLENGKIVESKLDKENIFTEKINDRWYATKFVMPNVKAGSVIEFTYSIYSDYIVELREWQFQKAIPVAWSEYTVKTPEYFTYLHLAQGFEQFEEYEVTSQAGSHASQRGLLNYKINVYHWLAKNMPALKNESYITNAANFYQKVEFQLATYRSPDGMFEPILGTWDKINSELLASSDFGTQTRPKGFYKDILATITASAKDQKEKAALIYKYVSENIKWNEINSFIPDENIRKIFDEKTGRSAGINMLLISMLNAAGIAAQPVITSTRNHGVVNPIHPILDKYNYLLAEAIIDGQPYLMDATSKNLALGMLPPRALNQLGRRISKDNPGWVDINPTYADEEMKYYILSVSEDGSVKGNLQRKKAGYNALKTRNKINLDGLEKYVKEMKEGLPSWEIENHKIENVENVSADITEKFDFSISNGAMAAGNMIYFRPLLDKGNNENPFKKEIRKLPIDFTYPLHEKYVVQISIPEGFVVEEMPKSVRLMTPGNACKFIYSIRNAGNLIQLTTEFNINKSFFGPDEYAHLKEFFNIVISKTQEQIVLKKI